MLAFLVTMALSAQAQAPCRPQHLTVSLDERGGDFNGMSHSGTLLVLRNRGAACRIMPLPKISFEDGKGQQLPIVRKMPVGMLPGPVMMPIILRAGGAVSTPLRWVSGPVFYPGRCFRPARIAVTIGGKILLLAFAGNICGPAGKAADFDQPPLKLGLNGSE